MSSTSHELCTAHHRGENLVVVLAAAQIARDAMRQFLTRRTWIGFEIPDRRHHEARHAERALEALLLDDRLLHRVQLHLIALARREALDRDDLLPARAVREHRAA